MRKRQRPPRPLLSPVAYHFPTQGTRRAQEAQFREHLRQFCQAWEEVLAPLVWEALMDHLYRTDGTGMTLCFDGPLRAELCAQVRTWLTAEVPTLLAAWDAVARLGSHGEVGRWNEVPEILQEPMADDRPKKATQQNLFRKEE